MSRAPVSPRRRQRVLAFQTLFMLDVGQMDLEQALDYGRQECPEAEERAWVEERVRGTWAGVENLDGMIQQHLQNWTWERVGRVERSLLRLAAYEMLNCQDLHFSAAISEAVELAKEYGEEKTAPFINGVLDSLWRAHSEESQPS